MGWAFINIRRLVFILLLLVLAAPAAAQAAKPVNLTLPTISGTPQVGQTLTRTLGIWSNSPTSYATRWQRCMLVSTGTYSNCTNITGVTGATYVVQTADVGAKIRAGATATNADGSTIAYSAKTAVVTAAAKPVNTTLPTISGTAQVEQTLTRRLGTWSNGPTSYRTQWQRCALASTGVYTNCSNITGATGATYVVQTADVGDKIRVVVTASNAYGSTTRYSLKTAVVTAASPPPSGQSIVVCNQSSEAQTQVTHDFANIQTDVNTIFVPEWASMGASPINITAYSCDPTTLANADIRVYVQDQPCTSPCAAYHTVGADGKPEEYDDTDTVAQSHEMHETVADPLISTYTDSTCPACSGSVPANSEVRWIDETDDESEFSGSFYVVGDTAMSDFVRQVWFIPQSAGPWDYNHLFTASQQTDGLAQFEYPIGSGQWWQYQSPVGAPFGGPPSTISRLPGKPKRPQFFAHQLPAS